MPSAPLRMVYLNKYYWDLIAATLASYEFDDYTNFLYSINLADIKTIRCTFDTKRMAGNKNEIAKLILARLNPDMLEKVEFSLEKFQELKDDCGYEKDVFFNMAVLVLYKDYKIITDFQIVCGNGRLITDLSEGGKKLLLIYGALNIIDGENLVLFDEPDAHLHEGRKTEIYSLLTQKSENQILVASHSPKLIRLFPYDNQIILRRTTEQKIEAITSHKFDEFKEILDTDITFEEEFAIRESRMPLLLVEGKTDKKHLENAWKKLYPKDDMPFVIVSLSSADKVRQYILSVPDNFSKSKIIGLVDNDKAGQDVKKGCEIIDENIYKFKNDVNQKRQAYCIILPFEDENVKLFNYYPIEFLYDVKLLLDNDVLEKLEYKEAVPKWIQADRKSIDEASYCNVHEKCFYKVKDSIKNCFAEKAVEFEKDQFAQFIKIFDMIRKVLAMH